MGWKSNFMNDVFTAVKTAWPDLAVVLSDTESGRIQWRDLIEKAIKVQDEGGSIIGEFNTPFAIVQFMRPTRTDDVGDYDEAYKAIVNVYYIMQKVDEDGEPIDTQALEAILNEREEALVHEFENDGPYSWFQCIEGCSTGHDLDVPANDYFASYRTPLYACMVTATLICGQQR